MSKAPVSLGVSFGPTSQQWRSLTSDIKNANGALSRQITLQLQRAGNLVSNDYKRVMAPISPRLASAVQVSVQGTQVTITNNERGASAIENDGNGGTFRHPTFGHRDRFVDQAAVPALIPALANNQAAMVQLLADAVQVWAEAAGFKSE